MTDTAETLAREIELFRSQARSIHGVIHLNVDDLTHEESLARPERGGNCVNWVLGHLIVAYDDLLPRLGRDRVLEEGALERYQRGSDPLTDPDEAVPLDELLSTWDRVCRAVDRGIRALTPERLASPAPSTPGQPEGEGTVRSNLTFVLFHQAYHAGQTGVLRRVAGKEGAIA